MNNNDIRNISKNFFGIILPNYMTFLKRIINQLKMSALTFRSRLIIKTEKASEELGHPNFNDFDFNIFAPANDPFVTAQELKLFIEKLNGRKEITNIYLSPLSTKAQALGFALYFYGNVKINR